MKKHLFLFSFLSLLLFACQENTAPSDEAVAKAVTVSAKGDPFQDYWYQGKAEISSFDLQQARYGEIHQGHAAMIFVTEEFSKNKQVKLDNPGRNPKDAVPILKLNMTRKFNTGIYPYSIMNSVFTPIDLKKQPHSLKVTASSQEWCGHTFMQLNQKKGDFAVQVNSYFESEGDNNFKVDKVLLEDEIWTRLRIDPKSLPTGKVKVLPGTTFARLKHIKFQAGEAEITMTAHPEQANLMIYQLTYSQLDRQLQIHFQKDFPHQIEGWEESYRSGWGNKAQNLTTKATRKKTILLDYWTRNSKSDEILRQQLDL